MKQGIEIIDQMMKFQEDRGLDKQEFNAENETANIAEEIFELNGYDVPKDKRADFKELVMSAMFHIADVLKLESVELTREAQLDALCDISEFTIGGMMKLKYCPHCALHEMAKHINSRTGKIIDGKFVKDSKVSPYEPNYKECDNENK